MGAHVLKMDSLLLQELKGLVHILQTVDAHSSLGGFRQPLSREDLQELDEHPSISKVSVQVCDPAGHSGEVGIDPLGEGLLLHGFALIEEGNFVPKGFQSARKRWASTPGLL